MPHHDNHHHDHPGRKHPLGHHHRHPHLPGLNSLFVEALGEMNGHGNIEELITTYAPHLNKVWVELQGENLNSESATLALLQIAEAQHMLQRRAELIRACALGRAVVVLPLPPHVTDLVFPVVTEPFILTAERHLPPHLSYVGATPIEFVLPNDIDQTFNEITAVVFEGLWDAGRLLTRRSVAGFLQTMARGHQQVDHYVHLLPHYPHDADLIPILQHATINFV
jgi:hypothetical protein